ncbi:type III secretion system inner membrane ring subunit SctD [Cupriavidus pampae]|uniref:EscD/YscD/HrpQ family type III secretion system inner membrane ring protein n=1 Tax=Cupriavidus pampae TaxID=659251 RepID=A0ABN7ZPB1_9BURK|nr:type III secretion system inner membrane ring subunit SctD [Cupriavidus pampae]CAG9185951.1 hypothetical protein LMG32289_06177 [Cupriavidus pampae]
MQPDIAVDAVPANGTALESAGGEPLQAPVECVAYQLKFLSGPLLGHSLALPEGDFLMGPMDADVHAETEGRHSALFSTSRNGVALMTSAPCWIDGRRTRKLPNPLPCQTPIDIDGITVALAPARDTVTPDTVPRRRDGVRWRRRLRRVATTTLALALSYLTGMGVWQYANQMPREITKDAGAAATDSWQEAASKLGIKTGHTVSGAVSLSGQCTASEQRDRVIKLLRSAHMPYVDSTLCQDEIERNVRAALRMHGYADVKVAPGNQYGTVFIMGRILSDDRWKGAVATLSKIRGLQTWSVEDDSASHVRRLIEVLRRSHMGNKLSVARENNLVLLTGTLSEDERQRLDTTIAKFSAEHPDASRVIYQNIPSASVQTSVFSSPVVSFGERNKAAFIDLANGTRVTAGSRLPSGYLIAQMDRQGIELERDGDVIYMPLNL